MEISNDDIVQEALFKWDTYLTAFISIHDNTKSLLLNTIQSKYYLCTNIFSSKIIMTWHEIFKHHCKHGGGRT